MSHRATTNPLPGVESRPGSGHYGVFDHGAHVWAWRPDGAAPVLWLSTRSLFVADKGIRGGVPICFPWFGAGRTGALTPAHGVARINRWRREAVEDAGEVLRVGYSLDPSITGTVPSFPHAYRAEFWVTFARERLEVAFTVTNTDTVEFSYEEALHTYLTVGDVRQISLDGLDRAPYLDKVAAPDQQHRVQDGPVVFTGETDRVYSSTAAITLTDPVLGRTLRVEKENSANTVVWNPWVSKAAAIADFGDDEWPQMVCIEAANAFDDAVTLRPGESHCLTQRIVLA